MIRIISTFCLCTSASSLSNWVYWSFCLISCFCNLTLSFKYLYWAFRSCFKAASQVANASSAFCSVIIISSFYCLVLPCSFFLLILIHLLSVLAPCLLWEHVCYARHPWVRFLHQQVFALTHSRWKFWLHVRLHACWEDGTARISTNVAEKGAWDYDTVAFCWLPYQVAISNGGTENIRKPKEIFSRNISIFRDLFVWWVVLMAGYANDEDKTPEKALVNCCKLISRE